MKDGKEYIDTIEKLYAFKNSGGRLFYGGSSEKPVSISSQSMTVCNDIDLFKDIDFDTYKNINNVYAITQLRTIKEYINDVVSGYELYSYDAEKMDVIETMLDECMEVIIKI